MAAIETEFAARLLAWFDRHGRHDLPWQHPRTPYRVWLSEIMLQQTQVSVVIPYFQRFVSALPDLPSLARAPQDDVLALWSGTGLLRPRAQPACRGEALHGIARRRPAARPRRADRAARHRPQHRRRDPVAGLGRCRADPRRQRQARAVPAVRHRRLARHAEGRKAAVGHRRKPASRDARLADYTQAQMDFGATLCTRADPACAICPLQDGCVALREGRVAELPVAKPGKPLPERVAHMLIIEDADGRVLLQRRPPTGVWASLWSLPEHADIEAARAWFDAHAHGDFDAAQAGDHRAHGFSHYRLHIHPHRITGVRPRDAVGDNDDLRWASARGTGRRSACPPRCGDCCRLPTNEGMTMARKVFCEVDKIETDGLDFAPWPGEAGKRVFAGVGKPAWQRWLAHQTMLINENRLSPLNPQHRAFLEGEMLKFLFGGGADKPAGYVPGRLSGLPRPARHAAP
jgi:A/G-specific adenine glycosylase